MKEDEKKHVLLLNLCIGTAFQLLNSSCFLAKPEKIAFKDLIVLFDKHFTPAKLIFPNRETFHCSTKNKEEHVQEWRASVRQLGEKYEFQDELEVVLHDRLLCGFTKGTIKKSENFILQKAIEIAGNKEASSRRSHEVVIKSEPPFGDKICHLGGNRSVKE
ncbi:hypothetical protein JTB14_002183 [Gonioctena quinquepunctata]|nr:hypothetical protein JTB14_002183 [Gonioctena quinquepunctata]